MATHAVAMHAGGMVMGMARRHMAACWHAKGETSGRLCPHHVPSLSGGCTPAAAATRAAWRRTSDSVASHCSAMLGRPLPTRCGTLPLEWATLGPPGAHCGVPQFSLAGFGIGTG